MCLNFQYGCVLHIWERWITHLNEEKLPKSYTLHISFVQFASRLSSVLSRCTQLVRWLSYLWYIESLNINSSYSSQKESSKSMNCMLHPVSFESYSYFMPNILGICKEIRISTSFDLVAKSVHAYLCWNISNTGWQAAWCCFFSKSTILTSKQIFTFLITSSLRNPRILAFLNFSLLSSYVILNFNYVVFCNFYLCLISQWASKAENVFTINCSFLNTFKSHSTFIFEILLVVEKK